MLHQFNRPRHPAPSARTGGPAAPMTQAQKDYIKDLIAKRDRSPEAQAIRTDLNAALEAKVLITKQLASRMIEALKGLPLNPPPLPVEQAEAVQAAVQAIQSMEDDEETMAALGAPAPKWLGKFALGDEPVLRFYQVDRPNKGKWAGWVFVKRLTGAPGGWRKDRLRGDEANRILQEIAADPCASQQKYGLHHGECGRCASPLSHPCSRAAGYGAICAGHNGWPYPTLEEAREILAERFGPTEAQRIEAEWAANPKGK